MYDFDTEEFQSAGVFNVKGLPDLYYLATMKDKVAILTNIDDDMIRDSICNLGESLTVRICCLDLKYRCKK